MKATRKSAKEFSLSETEAECWTLKSALNQVLELSESDYSTLIGGPKRRALLLLKGLGDALREPAATKEKKGRSTSK